MFHPQYPSGPNSPSVPPTPPIKRGRGRPPKNRQLIAQREAEALARHQAQLAQQQHQQQHPHLQQHQQTPQRPSHYSQLDTSPRPRPLHSNSYQSGTSSPYHPPPQYLHPGSPEHGMLYAPPQTYYAMPPPMPPGALHPIPAFPVMPTFQQQQHQAQLRQMQQQQHKPVAPSTPSAPSSDPANEGTIMTPAGGSIGAGLGQAVGNAGASPASRTRKRTDTSEPDLKVPEAGDLGWLPDAADADKAQAVYYAILKKLRDHKDANGKQLSEPLEICPDPEADPEYYERIEKPTSLSAIEQRVNSREYANSVAFEMDVLQMFENGRRSYPIGSSTYGDIVSLQRLYHQLSKSKPSTSDTITAADVEVAAHAADASKHFSSMPFGPGFASAGSEGELTTRISGKMKTYYEHLNFKGKAFRVGDWVHLMNPSDPARPIVAQIFKVSRRDDQPGQGWITVCWYFRPEQTFHPASKKFFRDEVAKTGYFADHQIEDVLEKILVMFYTKFIRGRPKPDYWDPKSPLYITECRYNEQQRVFHKIKSWASCVPEEIRKVETPMDFFEKAISPPPKEESPFLRGESGPGALRDEDPSGGDGHEFPDLFKDSADELRPKKRSKEHEAAQGSEGSSMMPPPLPQAPRTPSDLFIALATQVATCVTPQDYLKIQQLLSGPGAATLDMVQVSQSMERSVDPDLLNDLRNAAFAAGVANAAAQQAGAAQGTALGENGVAPEKAQPSNLENVMATQKGEGFYAELPTETQNIFAEQTNGHVTWYPAPPLDGPAQHEYHQKGFWQPQGGTSHSLDYLYDQVLQDETNKAAKVKGESQSSPTQANGNSTPRAMLHASSEMLSPAMTKSSPLTRPSKEAWTGSDEALTRLVSQNGWSAEWGEDPQKTADALAEFAGQFDSSQLSFSNFLSAD